MMENWINKSKKAFLKDSPMRDGSGKGLRLNKGRGGCDSPKDLGKGINKQLKNAIILGGSAILLAKAIDVLN